MFSARVIFHNDTKMLNICDSNLLGKTLIRDKLTLKINESYYGQKTVEKDEAERLLRDCNNINMVGKEIIALSTSLGIGSQKGTKEIDGIPFLLVFKL